MESPDEKEKPSDEESAAGGGAAAAPSGQPVTLVTGAAGELGRELVERLLAAGHDCVALDRNRRGLERLHDRLAKTGSAPLGVPLDLAGAGPDHYAELAAHIEDSFGRLDGIIHAAAEFKALRPLDHTPPDEWMQVLQAGITGPYLLTVSLLPLMRATPGSRVLWVQDAPRQRRNAHWGAYGVAQAGADALADILAAETASRGPAVDRIDPGPFYSPLRSRAWPAEEPGELPSAADAAGKVLARYLGG
ncbi:MAG: SDR family NAD(P)-dependent oxidoreductase [Wenzhouxiangellaceae bacterium]|nr:SDR family NAD(P)-dependent oxidoreductase [Wenzhouxiangellaceae bacterium]